MPDTPPIDLASLLAVGHARAAENADFLRWSPDGSLLRPVSFRTASDRSARLGGLFSAWGLAPGARLLIASADDQALAILFIACLDHGMTAVIVDHQATASEMTAILDIAMPDAAILDQALTAAWPLAAVPRVLAIAGAAKPSLFGKLLRRPTAAEAGPITYPAILDHQQARPPRHDLAADLDAYVLFTSGSTARPKGVRISRRALAVHTRTLIARWGYGPASRILDALPLHHTDGLIQGVFCAWGAGACCLRPGPFRVDATISLLVDPIYRERATHLVAVPTMLALILRYAGNETDAFRQPDFRFVISAAGYLDAKLWKDFETTFGVRVCNLYGLTETVTGSCFAGPDDASHVIGSVGVAVDCELSVRDSSGAAVASGVAGELHLRGPHVLSGYLHDDDATAATLQAGWVATGDLATVDGAGIVRIVGRRKNLVITGGLNIQPEEVAEFLRSRPGVGDAVAFGMPDPVFGEILVACVAPARPGTHLDPADLTRDCQAGLSPFKVPKAIVPVPALPYGPSGKVLLPRARELFAHATVAAVPTAGSPRERLHALAAEVFHRPVESLQAEDAPGRTPGWDSFAHLALITAIEGAFRLHLGAADILAIKTLGDAEAVIARKLATGAAGRA